MMIWPGEEIIAGKNQRFRILLAQPPVLSSVTVSAERHPSAGFSAPKASDVTIYIASKPDRATAEWWTAMAVHPLANC